MHAAAARPDADGLRIALVGETQSDAREVMVEGISGLLGVHPAAERPTWQSSRRRLEWPNGAVAQVFSSEDPDALRGPQFHLAWCDELAKWRHVQETWDMLQFALRLGDRPRQLVTTTPRPIPLLKRLLADPGTRAVTAPTESNAAHLAAGFVAAIRARYGGTRLARQELDGEMVESRDGACGTATRWRHCAATGRRRWSVSSSRSIRRQARVSPRMPAASLPPGSTATGSFMCWPTGAWARLPRALGRCCRGAVARPRRRLSGRGG